ncbi:MAG: hypothetical protein WBQ10_14995 [Terriglobales bacterium]
MEKTRIYLSEHVCELLTTFVDAVRKSAIGINIYVPIDQPLNPALLKEKVKIVTEVYEAFQGKIPAVRAALENEFRAILGAE